MTTSKAGTLVLCFCLVGCASNSGVVQIGPDTFSVSRQAATGFTGLGHLKGDAINEAQQYCASKSKEVRIVHESESQPPYLLGNFPRAEVQFMCLSPGDPELTRPKPQPASGVVVNVGAPPQPPVPATASKVSVAITSEPAGADVYVDGSFVGNTPLPHFSLPPGEHVIELQRQGFEKWNRRLLVSPDAPTAVSATLTPLPR